MVLAIREPELKVPIHLKELEMAGEPGFEPRFSESESDVLPLNYSPMGFVRAVPAAIKLASDMRQFS